MRGGQRSVLFCVLCVCGFFFTKSEVRTIWKRNVRGSGYCICVPSPFFKSVFSFCVWLDVQTLPLLLLLLVVCVSRVFTK